MNNFMSMSAMRRDLCGSDFDGLGVSVVRSFVNTSNVTPDQIEDALIESIGPKVIVSGLPPTHRSVLETYMATVTR